MNKPLAASIVACAIAFGSPSATGQDRAELLERVETLREEALSGGIQGSARDDAIGRALAAREALMAAHPDDPQRPIWLLDQAADTLLRLSVSLDDARLVVGLHDGPGRSRALARAEEAYALADTAGGLIDDRFRAQRALLDAGEEISESDRELNRRLAEQELVVRRPLLIGRAMALQVAASGPEADADKAIQVLASVRVPEGAASRLRDVSMAIALRAQGGQDGKTRARDLLEGVTEQNGGGDPIIAEAVLLNALLAGDLPARLDALGEASVAPPFVSGEGVAVPSLGVLAVEARARVHAEAREIERAAREVLALEHRRDLGGSRAERAALADSRLAAIAQRYQGWTEASSEVVLRAARALVSRDEPLSDARARRLLEGMLSRIRIASEEAVEAGLPFAVPVERDPARVLLARLYLVGAQAARDPEQAAAWQSRAMDLVVHLLGAESRNLDGLLAPAATLALLPPAAHLDADQRLSILTAALDRFPAHASADRWRLGRAALLLRDDPSSRAALDDAQAAMASDDPGTRADAIALAGAVHTSLVSGLAPDASDRDSAETLRRALAFLDAHAAAAELDAERLRRRLAAILMGRESAANARETLSLLRGLDSTPALSLIARAHDVLGARDRATRSYRDLAARVSIADGDEYWDVWVRLLELIDQERQDRMRAGSAASGAPLARTLRSHLLRLRAEDANLGGGAYRRRLDAIASRLDGAG